MLSMQDTFLLLNIVRLSHLMELEEPASQSLRALQQILSLQSLHKVLQKTSAAHPPGESSGLCRKEDSETSDELLTSYCALMHRTHLSCTFLHSLSQVRASCLFVLKI